MSKIPHIIVPDMSDLNAAIAHVVETGGLRFDARNEVGKGRYGVVYAAVTSENRHVVIKVVRGLEAAGTSSFITEAHIQREAGLHGIAPRVIDAKIVHYGQQKIGLLIMDRGGADGYTHINRIIKKVTRNEMSRDEANNHLRAMIGGVMDLALKMKAAGICHADLFEANIVTSYGNASKWLVIDFGFAQMYDPASGARLHRVSDKTRLMRDMKMFVEGYDAATFLHMLRNLLAENGFGDFVQDAEFVIHTLDLGRVWKKHLKMHLWDRYLPERDRNPPESAIGAAPLDYSMLEMTQDDFNLPHFRSTNAFNLLPAFVSVKPKFRRVVLRTDDLFSMLAEGDFIFQRCLSLLDPAVVEQMVHRRMLIYFLAVASYIYYVPRIPSDWETVEPLETLTFE